MVEEEKDGLLVVECGHDAGWSLYKCVRQLMLEVVDSASGCGKSVNLFWWASAGAGLEDLNKIRRVCCARAS